MSEFVSIEGGKRLAGTVKVSGAKNAALPLLIAGLLSAGRSEFKNVPNIYDVHLLLQLLTQCGAEVERTGDTVSIITPQITSWETSYSLVKALRASFWVLAPLLVRAGNASVALPGGDLIGARPVDLHLEALTKMGAELTVSHGVILGRAPHGLHPADINFRFPSVGATHQVLMAAAAVKGETIIRGAAREPEIVALAQMLSSMGAKIEGAGTSTISIRGEPDLSGASVSVIGDRIEAGTYAMAAAATGGAITIEGVDPYHLGSFIPIMKEMGLSISTTINSVSVASTGRLKPVKISTEPFPGFATDLQAVTMAALSLASGESIIEEHIFEGRFRHVAELCRMGAQISVQEHIAVIHGVSMLSGAPVEGHDIRAAAALVVAGLAAEGRTDIHEPQHLRRGYDALEDKLRGLGASISVRFANPEEQMFPVG